MIVLLLAPWWWGCTPAPVPPEAAPEAAESAIVEIAGRRVDLAPHLRGFPYEAALAVPQRGLLFYDHVGATRTFTVLDADPARPPDLAAGRPVGAIDWSTRSRWNPRWHDATGTLWYVGDERNDERLNLWRLDPDDGVPVALTDEPYLYGWAFDNAEQRIAVLARRGDGPYTTCLRTMNLDGADARDVSCDTPELTFTWDRPVWSPDGRAVVTAVNVAGRRDRQNLALVDLATGERRVITDPRRTRSEAAAVGPWLDAHRFVVRADDSGWQQLAVYDTRDGKLSWLTRFDRALTDVVALEPADRPLLLAVLHRPDGDRLVVIDPNTAAELGSVDVDGTVTPIGDDRAGRVVVAVTSTRTPFSLAQVTVGADGAPSFAPWADVPEAIRDRIVRCDVSAVKIPTFDVDPATGAARELHAWLYEPKEPPSEDAKLARVLAFYGGDNRFSVETQVFCDAGIATLSPAVRGSDGFGSAFYRLNDGDLGGDEIVDLFYAARVLESRGWRRGRIGVYGRSHGGYATMRALTWPPDAAHPAYPFAFGIADAGFSDILTFWRDSNIPDWVVTEAGDPVADADRLRDRSPVHHADRLSAPLFLAHGENDSRVPVAESRQMAEACAKAGKTCVYLEFPGQGHRVRGLANEQRLYQAKLSFLEAHVLSSPPPARAEPPAPPR